MLLPTRNGGEYLDDAIASVLSQPYEDMEIVVSDNASDANTRDVVARFAADKRLKYVRLEQIVTVTENWNHALEVSRGDYLVMIGDDDCVLPRFFETLDAAIDRHQQPDCITYNGFTFVFPESITGQRTAWFGDQHFRFGGDFTADAELSRAFRRGLVNDMFRFKVRFPLNMQLTLFSRRAAGMIRGKTFRAPFPDHYALNAMLLLADRFVYIPDRLVVVGISPKSFGHFYYGGEQRAGASYLGLGTPDDGRLPGSELLNYMREWLGLLKREYADFLSANEISRWNYAGRQVYHWMRDFEFGRIDSSELVGRASLLSWPERLNFVLPLLMYRGALRGLRAAGLRRRERFMDMLPALQPLAAVSSMQDFSEWLRERGLA